MAAEYRDGFHWHTCNQCFFPWEHANNCGNGQSTETEFDEAHTCPNCGSTEQTLKAGRKDIGEGLNKHNLTIEHCHHTARVCKDEHGHELPESPDDFRLFLLKLLDEVLQEN